MAKSDALVVDDRENTVRASGEHFDELGVVDKASDRWLAEGDALGRVFRLIELELDAQKELIKTFAGVVGAKALEATGAAAAKSCL